MTITNNLFKLSNFMDQVFDQLQNSSFKAFEWDTFIPTDIPGEKGFFPSYPKTNCYISKDQSVTLECAVPGMTKENITVQLDGDTLTVVANKKEPEADTGDKKYLNRDLAQRSFTIKYQLSKRLDAEKTTVKVENGVLTINIPPKIETAEQRKIITFPTL